MVLTNIWKYKLWKLFCWNQICVFAMAMGLMVILHFSRTLFELTRIFHCTQRISFTNNRFPNFIARFIFPMKILYTFFFFFFLFAPCAILIASLKWKIECIFIEICQTKRAVCLHHFGQSMSYSQVVRWSQKKGIHNCLLMDVKWCMSCISAISNSWRHFYDIFVWTTFFRNISEQS